MRLLLTGATGFLGRHLVRALLERSSGIELDLLVRPRGVESARHRVERILPELETSDGRLRVVEGRLDRPLFDLADGDYRDLCDRVDRVLHGAANVRFDLDLEAARRANVLATRHVLEFARDAGAGRLDHVSTCFVAGRRTDRVMEGELAHDSGFRNTYERSKYEAELLLKEAAGIDITVFRPSIVVGHSDTGVTSSFHMIYWPMKLYSRGWWRTLVARPDTPVDVVPVDFVARAIALLLDAPGAAGRTFHLAAGAGRQSCVAELAEMTRAAVGGPPVRFIDPDTFLRWVQPVLDPLLFTRKGRAIKRGGHIYLPYFTANPTFDTTDADALLAPKGLVPPRVGEYFTKLIDYARETDFGRRADPRT